MTIEEINTPVSLLEDVPFIERVTSVLFNDAQGEPAIGDFPEVFHLILSFLNFEGHQAMALTCMQGLQLCFHMGMRSTYQRKRFMWRVIKEGQLAVAQWLRAQNPPCPMETQACSVMAAESGHLALLQWLRAEDPQCPMNASTCAGAARCGHMHILRYLRSLDPPCPWDHQTCDSAALGGHLPILVWLREEQGREPCPWGHTTCDSAAEGGHLEVLQWLRRAEQQEERCPLSHKIGAIAARHGHLDILQWIFFNAGALLDGEDEHERRERQTAVILCGDAAAHGHLHIVQFLRDQNCMWEDDSIIQGLRPGFVSRAAYDGHLNVLRYIFTQDDDFPVNFGRDDAVCNAAVRGNQLEVLKWLRAQKTPVFAWSNQTAFYAAEGGHLEILKWMRSQSPPCPWDEAVCTVAAINGKLDILQYLRSSEHEEPCPLSATTVQEASFAGQAHVVRWLRTLDPGPRPPRVFGRDP